MGKKPYFSGKQRDLLDKLATWEDELDIGSSIQKEMDDAMAEMTDVFGEVTEYGGYGGTGSYTGAAGNGGTTTLASDMARIHDDLQRMRNDLHNMHGKRPPPPKPQGPPNTNEFGEAIVQVGKHSGSYKYEAKHFEADTFTEFTISFDDEDNYRVVSNTGGMLPAGRIRSLIRMELRKIFKNDRFKSPVEVYDVNEADVGAEILQRIRERTKAPKAPKGRIEGDTDRYEHIHFMDEQGALFYHRTLLGGKGDPVTLRPEATVVVSGHNMFGRKYSVKIDGNAMHTPKIELHLTRCFGDDQLSNLVASRTDEEKHVLAKLLEGLIALKIAEEHHIKLNELL